ncbi:MAG TPA: nuclear transport factor 2 family protein [Albitalea sp.]|nr:nuclear transport factor 2 family protein [Albitalea sp.]
MPSTETLERFIARVESNAHADAAAEFYAPDATLQENQSEPRVGRDAQVARERAVIGRAKAMRSHCVRPVFVNGDHVAIRWIFEFDWKDGTTTRMEEVACQTWKGEHIVAETFFYDPAQRVPKPSTTA